MKASTAIAAAITVLMISSPGLAADGDMTVDGNLVVGTGTSLSKLGIATNASVTGSVTTSAGLGSNAFALQGEGGTLNTKSGIYASWNGNNNLNGLASGIVFGREGNVWGTYVALHTHPEGGNVDDFIERLRVTKDGYTGIGTVTPTDRLHIENGFIKTRVFPADDITQDLTGYSLESRETGGGTHTWRLYTAPVGGGYGVPANSLTIWEYGSAAYAPRMVFQRNTGNVGIGYTNPTYTLHVNGSFAASSKNFDIPDPRYNDETKRLIHSTLEGPEIGVYYRGEAKLEQGKATVTLPPYFEALTRKEDRTVLLTAKFATDSDLLCNIAASEVKDSQFTIMAYGVSDPTQCSHKAYWEVKAVRSDVAKLKVEDTRGKTKDEMDAKEHEVKLKEKKDREAPKLEQEEINRRALIAR